MQNLAGNPEADEYIKRELTRCGITIVDNMKENSEVPYTVIGKLGKFEFRRAWYYWVVDGRVPIDIAMALWYNPVGQTDIRVDGHCGCPSPKEFGTRWFDKDGQQILHLKEKAEFEKYAALDSESVMKKVGEEGLKKFLFHEQPELVGQGFVESYHIDSELGLYIFVQTLKKYELV